MLSYKKRKRYKYFLCEPHCLSTEIRPAKPIHNSFIELNSSGKLTIKASYAWDGASWFPDLPSILYPSLVHDAFYQLLREKELPQSQRKEADRLLRDLCRNCGMGPLLAWLVYVAVRTLAGAAARPDLKRMPADSTCSPSQ